MSPPSSSSSSAGASCFAGFGPELDAPNENEEEAGVAEDWAELEVGRGEKEKPVPAGLVLLPLELDPKEKEGALEAEALAEGPLNVEAGVVADLLKLKLGRLDEQVEPAEGAGTAVEDEPLVAGLNGLAVALKEPVLPDDGAELSEGDLSTLSRCLRY